MAALDKAKYLSPSFQILGLSRRKVASQKILPKSARRLKKYLKTLQIDIASQADYQKIRNELPKNSQVVFYLAVPPTAVENIIEHLGRARLNGRKTKLLLEKPFGTDLASARILIKRIQKFYDEGQVYRIDHYLAKEAAQNLAVFLGANAVFREVWNRYYIEYIEIEASEQIGIENRTDFWESTGTLRDFVQSHILQLAALVLMEPCDDFADVERMPALRLSALKQLKVDPANVVRAQYSGYRREVGNSKSTAETFVALTARSDDPRWHGVPIYLATGKKLNQKLTEIRVKFKKVNGSRANLLTLRIQPKEGIEFDLWVKKPGHERQVEKLGLRFFYEHHFVSLPDAYEQVLLDVFDSNHSLFASSAEVIASWQTLQLTLDAWAKSNDDLKLYRPGSSIEKILGKPV